MSPGQRENNAEVEEIDLEEIPRIGMPIIGIFLIYAAVSVGLNDMMLNLVVGGAGAALIVLFAVLAGKKYQEAGVQEALDYALTAPVEEKEIGEETSKKEDQIEKTPPAPEKLKNELYFERANRKCEWCGEEIDQFEVHHITPRSEGGPNTRSNLIVLCPNCHAKADKGALAKERLRYRIRNNGSEE